MSGYSPVEEIRQLFTKGQPLAYAKGEVILGNELEPDGVYFISTGYIKEYSISDDGDEYLHIIFGQDELFPLTWAYLGVHPQSLFYETLSEATLWRISRSWFTKYAMTDLSVGYALAFQLARQFRIFTDRVDNLEYKKARERVAYRLLFLASRFGTKVGDTIVIEAPITHEVFANSINLARESVSREVEKLEKAGIIETNNRHKLIIKDVRALAGTLSRPVGLDDWHLM